MKSYKPGKKVPISGVYEAQHGNSHRLEHELTVAQGTFFPLCRLCGHHVKFRLLQPRNHAEQGWAPFGVLFEPYQIEPKGPEPQAA